MCSSDLMDGSRLRSFSPFEQWRAVLETPGITFVNMQYGETEAEIAQAKTEYGIDIWQPPGINLKDDLADVGALACALDLTLGFSNATTNIAAACGAPVQLGELLLHASDDGALRLGIQVEAGGHGNRLRGGADAWSLNPRPSFLRRSVAPPRVNPGHPFSGIRPCP